MVTKSMNNNESLLLLNPKLVGFLVDVSVSLLGLLFYIPRHLASVICGHSHIFLVCSYIFASLISSEPLEDQNFLIGLLLFLEDLNFFVRK